MKLVSLVWLTKQRKKPQIWDWACSIHLFVLHSTSLSPETSSIIFLFRLTFFFSESEQQFSANMAIFHGFNNGVMWPTDRPTDQQTNKANIWPIDASVSLTSWRFARFQAFLQKRYGPMDGPTDRHSLLYYLCQKSSFTWGQSSFIERIVTNSSMCEFGYFVWRPPTAITASICQGNNS